MGEMIKMRIWVDVYPTSNQTNSPLLWTLAPLGKVIGTKRYQINFEVPQFEPEVDGTVEGEVIELPDGKGVMVR